MATRWQSRATGTASRCWIWTGPGSLCAWTRSFLRSACKGPAARPARGAWRSVPMAAGLLLVPASLGCWHPKCGRRGRGNSRKFWRLASAPSHSAPTESGYSLAAPPSTCFGRWEIGGPCGVCHEKAHHRCRARRPLLATLRWWPWRVRDSAFSCWTARPELNWHR